MKINYRINTLLILALSFILALTSCKVQNHSELEKRLETIFYNEDFTQIPENVFNVADYGATGDSVTLNTSAIQKTIDAAHEAGGGKVTFPKGTYITGALFIKSNVDFHIPEGVRIKAIQDDEHYPEIPTRIAGIEMLWPSALINVYEENNVRISGTGIIDGNGKYWWDKFWGDPPRSGGMYVDYVKRDLRWAVDYDCKRVRAVVVYKSTNVQLKDFTVERSGFWTVTMTYSDRVHVDGLVIRNNIGGFGPSSDGVNTDSSRDILVENCDIDCNDDNLCIKSGKDADGLRVNRPAENIIYRNCITRRGHGLITLGSETSGGMRNIEVYGLKAEGTTIGIRFKSAKVRGGLIENITFRNIEMKDVEYPFHFELNWYPEYSYPEIPANIPEEEIPQRWKTLTAPVTPPEKGIPEFRHINFRDIHVINARQAIYSNAYPEKPASNFSWKDISIEARESGVINHARNWTMENVVVTSDDGIAIEQNNCKQVEQPKLISLQPKKQFNDPSTPKIEEQLTKYQKQYPQKSLIPIDPLSNSIIQEKDSLHQFPDTLLLYLVGEEKYTHVFYEPHGDGFYFNETFLSYQPDKKIIEIKAEKEHIWQILAHKNLFINEPDKKSNWNESPNPDFYLILLKGDKIILDIP